MSIKYKILLVDNDQDILDFLKYNLIKEGYEIHLANNGYLGVEKARIIKPDLILMDVTMPEMDGIEACMQIREDQELNKSVIAFLTARDEDYTQEAAFKSGADDYILKPIKPNVLLSRVKALLKRNHIYEENEISIITRLGELRINRDSFNVFIGGNKLYFPQKQFEFIALLASAPLKVFSRDEIIEALWNDDEYVNDKTIDVHLRRIREKLGEDIIRTIRGVGYTFN